MNDTDRSGRTPAMAAALRGNRPLLEFLLEHGADFSIRNSHGRTAAFFAAMNGHVRCLAFIADGAVDNAVHGEGDRIASASLDGRGAAGICVTPFTNGNSSEVSSVNRDEVIIGAAPGVPGFPTAASETADVADKIGCTPLWTAAAHGHLEVVRYLAWRGASPNTRDVTGTTAIWMTAGGGNVRCLEALIEAGADTDLANEDGLTPTLIAAQEGHASCIRSLAAAGADLGRRDLAGNSAVALASMGGHLHCLNVSQQVFRSIYQSLCLSLSLSVYLCLSFNPVDTAAHVNGVDSPRTKGVGSLAGVSSYRAPSCAATLLNLCRC